MHNCSAEIPLEVSASWDHYWDWSFSTLFSWWFLGCFGASSSCNTNQEQLAETLLCRSAARIHLDSWRMALLLLLASFPRWDLCNYRLSPTVNVWYHLCFQTIWGQQWEEDSPSISASQPWGDAGNERHNWNHWGENNYQYSLLSGLWETRDHPFHPRYSECGDCTGCLAFRCVSLATGFWTSAESC